MKILSSLFAFLLFLVSFCPADSKSDIDGGRRDISVVFNPDGKGGAAGKVELYDRMIAVVIGIDSYRDLPAEDQLRYAVRDAKGVGQVLREKYNFDEIVELYDEDAVKSRIVKILQGDLSNTGEQDAVLIYFAGHGVTRSTGNGDLGYLVPHDGSLRHDETYKNISMQQIKFDVCPLIRAKHVLIVADACFGGLLLTRAGSMQPSRTMAYLKEITGEQVRQIITAGGKDQTVLDGGPGGHSVFTGRLIHELRSVGGFVTAKQLGLALRKSVHGEAAARGHDQMPQVGEIYGSGDFVFVPDAARQRKKAEEEVCKLQQELESLQALQALAEKRREDARIRELERQRLEKELELKNAKHREDAARMEEKLRREAEDAAKRDEALQAQMEDERNRQLASLKIQAKRIREELGAPGRALGLEMAAEEIRRINSFLQKMESETDKSLQAQLALVRENYAARLTSIQNIPPRDQMFETKEDYRVRLEKSRKEADALRARQLSDEKAILESVFAATEKDKADLLRQREDLTSAQYNLGHDLVDFKLFRYYPEKEHFEVYLYIGKSVSSGACAIPKANAKLCYQNPDLLIPTVVMRLSKDAQTYVHEARFSGPEGDSFPISNIFRGKVVDRDRHFAKFENNVVVDLRNGLEWYAGPDGDTNWKKANRWAENLKVDGGGWRMPKLSELKRLYEKGRGSRNMTPLLETTGWSVWSGEKEGRAGAYYLNFANGGKGWGTRNSDYIRNGGGFAVRSR